MTRRRHIRGVAVRTQLNGMVGKIGVFGPSVHNFAPEKAAVEGGLAGPGAGLGMEVVALDRDAEMSYFARMEPKDPAYEYPVEWINHTEGMARPAGIYLLDGAVRLAARHSAAEASLLRAGALYVATLCFGPSPFERGFSGRAVRATAPARLVRWSAGAGN